MFLCMNSRAIKTERKRTLEMRRGGRMTAPFSSPKRIIVFSHAQSDVAKEQRYEHRERSAIQPCLMHSTNRATVNWILFPLIVSFVFLREKRKK